ncbi:MAG: zinc-binding dehydrogenase, partial [Actinomycetes bacterium]
PVGLASLVSLVDRGHDRVVVVEPSATRRQIALGLGAQAALDPATDDVWAALADLHGTTPFMFGPTPATAAFIEATGVPEVLGQIVDRCRVGARLSVVALHYAPVATSFLMVLMKELTIRGSMEYPERFADAIDLLARRDVSSVLTDRFPLERFDDALALLEGSKECGKVLVEVNGALQ